MDSRRLLFLELDTSTPANTHLLCLCVSEDEDGLWDWRARLDGLASGELCATDAKPGVPFGELGGDSFRRFMGLSGVLDGRSCAVRVDSPFAKRLARNASVGELGT